LPLLGTVNKIKFKKETVLESISTYNEEEKRRDNTFLELLRKLRYEIESSNKKIFLFTSTEPQQGKTMLIQALSFILNLGKKKVLIIDTNFCNNDLTVANKANPVLETFELNGKPFDNNHLNNLVSPTVVTGVNIIGCAGGDYTPSEILPRNHLLLHLDKLKDEYDFIFLEGAPLNEFTDTKELLPYADGLIAVFSAEKNFTAADKESIRFLEENRNKFLGAILNKVDDDHLEL
jgi:Mrp family chromosome partitioning ATPase